MSVYGTRDGAFHAKKLIVEDKIVTDYVIPFTATVGTGAIVTGWDPNAATAAITVSSAGFLLQPPYPATIRVIANAAGVAADRIRVTGYDSLGNLRYEDVQVGATAAAVHDTNYAYSKITELKPYDSSGNNATTASDSIGIYFTGDIGLPYPIASSADMISFTVGSAGATTMPTIDTTYHTVSLSGAQLANKAIHIRYLTKLQE